MYHKADLWDPATAPRYSSPLLTLPEGSMGPGLPLLGSQPSLSSLPQQIAWIQILPPPFTVCVTSGILNLSFFIICKMSIKIAPTA